ncbi:tetratricopeptide repeat protein [Fulvivirga ulvae]|uniref:tetratricopeptide repeat protein n=1 Tax=Fulvivirga ulvae TaxID=2904245 RepID=UPI001F2055E6|nr:tetratricopeptide repeat protein [Fulvivirga ulvae]UII32207.1 tetratricopeptide repeat protein [Fulvivirga ulvae]UII32240.1 tetratricopeptide repeat protein [Fulvivirga ulvae]
MLTPKPAIVLLLFFLLISCNNDEADPLKKASEDQELESTFEKFQNQFTDREVAYNLLARVKTVAEAKGNYEYLAKYYAGYGYLKRQELHYDQAVTSYQQALELYEDLGDSLHQGWVLNNLGYVFRLGNMPEQALTYFYQAEGYYEGISRQDKLIGLYENIGLIFLDHDDYEVAEKYLQKGLYLSQKYDNSGKIAVFNNLYGKLYFKQGDYDLARTWYLKALEFVQDNLQRAYTLGNIGESYLLEKKPDAAKEWNTKAMHIKESIENADIKPNLNYMGMYQAQKGKYKEALALFDKVVKLSEDNLLEKEMAVAIKNIRGIYNDQSQLRDEKAFERLLYYSDLLQQSNELLLELQKELRTLYDQSLIKKGVADYADLVEKKKQEEQKAMIQTGSGAFIMLTLVLVFFGVKKLRRVSLQRETYRTKIDQDKKMAKELKEEMIQRGILESAES